MGGPGLWPPLANLGAILWGLPLLLPTQPQGPHQSYWLLKGDSFKKEVSLNLAGLSVNFVAGVYESLEDPKTLCKLSF